MIISLILPMRLLISALAECLCALKQHKCDDLENHMGVKNVTKSIDDDVVISQFFTLLFNNFTTFLISLDLLLPIALI